MTQIFISRQLPAPAQDFISARFSCQTWEQETPPQLQDLLEIAPKIDGLICMLTDPINERFLMTARKLKVISQMAVGTDNIDLATATSRRIPVGHTPDVLTEACADHTWALLLAVARRVTESNAEVHQGIWRPWGPNVLCGMDVHGATLGIVGFGRIGQAVAQRATGFSMQVCYTTRKEQAVKTYPAYTKVNLDELLERSDFVSVHVPLSSETRAMFTVREFAKMKRTAIFVNTSRGAVVNSSALDTALRERMIAGAGLDVFEPEPIPMDHPILTFPNVVITPHISSATFKTREKMAALAVQNLIAGLQGDRMLHCANPEVYASPAKQ